MAEQLTIEVMYSCHDCGLRRVKVYVPAREAEDVVSWMNKTILHLGTDHAQRSPHCRPEKLSDVMIPIDGVDRVGGAPVN